VTNETARHEAPPAEAQQPDRQDPLKVFGSIFRQQLDHAIEPIMENIRRHNESAGQDAPAEATVRRATTPRAKRRKSAGKVSRKKDSAPHVLSLSIDRPQAESGLHSVLDMMLETVFSNELQETFRKQYERTLQSMVEAGQKAVAKGQSLDARPEQFAHALDQLVHESFSDKVREQARRDGEQVIRGLIGWDGTAARKAGTGLVSHLMEQRLAAAETFWQHVLVTLLKAGQSTQQPKNSKAEDDAGTADSAPGSDIPQTLLRSDKRAQEIWVKARDKAADKDGPGVTAERAAYAVLKQRYEKKGDHWVKKTGDASNGAKASEAHEEKQPAEGSKTRSKS
jgi:hypothetical protein